MMRVKARARICKWMPPPSHALLQAGKTHARRMLDACSTSRRKEKAREGLAARWGREREKVRGILDCITGLPLLTVHFVTLQK